MQQDNLRRCPRCHGKGTVPKPKDIYEANDSFDVNWRDCLRCHGAGFLPPTDDDD